MAGLSTAQINAAIVAAAADLDARYAGLTFYEVAPCLADMTAELQTVLDPAGGTGEGYGSMTVAEINTAITTVMDSVAPRYAGLSFLNSATKSGQDFIATLQAALATAGNGS